MKYFTKLFTICAFLVATIPVSAGDNADLSTIKAVLTGFKQTSDGRVIFYVKLKSCAQRYLFIRGLWRTETDGWVDPESGFEIPQGFVSVHELSGAFALSVPGGAHKPVPNNYSTKPISSGGSFYILSRGGMAGERPLYGNDCFVGIDVITKAMLARDADDPSGDRELRMVFYIPIYALEKNGTQMVKIGEVSTTEALVHIDAKERIEVRVPAKPSEAEKKWPNFKEILDQP